MYLCLNSSNEMINDFDLFSLLGFALIYTIYQIFRTSMVRFFHARKVVFAAEKSNLAVLRKKTGYTFANCKKALELHQNDVTQAEVWLKEQAQALGWSKATKLEGRQTTQGLIGVAVKKQDGVLIEVNCETDFVARNEEFQKMVQETANTCLKFSENHQKPLSGVTKVSRKNSTIYIFSVNCPNCAILH